MPRPPKRCSARARPFIQRSAWRGRSPPAGRYESGVPAMNAPQRDIRGVLITVGQGRLLLPNASVAEVITFSAPEPVENAPAWMLVQIRWRGWRLPLVSFSRFAGW